MSTLTTVIARFFQSRLSRDVASERDRLRQDVLGEGAITQTITGGITGSGLGGTPNDDGTSQQVLRRPSNDPKFAALLIEYYAYGLTQARRSSSVSLACSFLGGMVLITGVALAIFRAETNGELQASIVASVAGVLTGSIGVLFHRRADLALSHMEKQTQLLHDDMKAERDAGQALILLKEITDPALKAQLQAALVLKLSGADLPPLESLGTSRSAAEDDLPFSPVDLGRVIDQPQAPATNGGMSAR
ncbi:hypothetical protein AB0I39_01595 [Kitasatospora purpeofusca]|uniref:TRADD-N-associated membrane domain-containing protein n=1 Tax=Kitasatospora purpeofusca TaxID=67352 RepID=UPI0033C81ED0